MSAHYKQPLDWSDQLLKSQSKVLDKWYSIYSSDFSEKLPGCFNVLLDDMNTPLYISKLHDLFTQSQNGNVEKIKDLLVQQIFSTVRWRETLIYISKAKVKNFIEIGPGKALTGMVKRTIKDVNSFSINSIADIKNLNNEFKK